MLYQSYKDPAKVEAMRTNLESQILALESTGQRVAPGLHAELGTLYLQSGNKGKAKAFYIKERDTWPESRGLMNAVIDNLDKEPKRQTETPK